MSWYDLGIRSFNHTKITNWFLLSPLMRWRGCLANLLRVGLLAVFSLGSVLPATSLADAIVQGTVFIDTNGNGVQDVNEVGIPNIPIKLQHILSPPLPTIDRATDTDGKYVYDDGIGVVSGNYHIWVELPSGWTQITPSDNPHSMTVGNDDLEINFGVQNLFPPAPITISGSKFEDANHNGIRDPGEIGLAGEIIYIRQQVFGEIPNVFQITTNAQGNYSFDGGIENSEFTLSTIIPSDKVNSTPPPSGQSGMLFYTMTLLSGGSRQIDFGIRTAGVLPDICYQPLQGNLVESNGNDDWQTTPTANDTALILKNHKVIHKKIQKLQVRTLCIEEGGLLEGSRNQLKIVAVNVYNGGTILGATGNHGQWNNGLYKFYKPATNGGNVLLEVSNSVVNQNTGKIQGGIAGQGVTHGDQFYLNNVPYSVLSPGNGQDIEAQGAKGGNVDVYSLVLNNEGVIGPDSSPKYVNGQLISDGGNGGVGSNSSWAGDGNCGIYDPSLDLGWGYNYGDAYGGNGGKTTIVAGIKIVSSGRISSGYGGDARASWCEFNTEPGAGGGLQVVAPSVDVSGIFAGGGGRRLSLEPDIMLGGTGMRIEDSEAVVIFGGDNWNLNLNNLTTNAITATKTITLAVGKGGVINLRNNDDTIFKAGDKVEIYADTILLDDGITLEDLIDAPSVEVHPSKILYEVALSGPGTVTSAANTTTPVEIRVQNVGPTSDTYTLNFSDSAGWPLSNLPNTVTVDGLSSTELSFDVALPANYDAKDIITVTATSQADSSTSATTEIIVTTNDEDGDGVVNEADNCPNLSNPEQSDFDNDGRGDVCDPGVIIRASSDLAPVCPGDDFEITLQVVPTNSSYPINAVQAYLEFDPTKFQVNNITNSGSMDMLLEANFNNTDGYIHLGAATFLSPPPTETFDFVTIHLTALGESGNTTLAFDPESTFVASKTERLPQVVYDVPIVLQCQLKYQVNLQGRTAPPHASWITTLTLSGDTTGTVTTNDLGQGELPQALANGNYTLCVKNAHTLQNQITFTVPLTSDFVDFGTLLEGDADNDNHIDLMDFVQVYLGKDQCDGDPNYNVNADFNADGCVGIADAQLLATNYGQAGQSCGEPTTAASPRRRPRDSYQAFSLAIPENLTVGSRFEVPIQVYADADNPVASASAHLNFDPQRLQVNSLTKGNHSLDFLLQNRFDNTLGTIDFVAVLWDGEVVKEPFTLATVELTLLAEGGEQTLSLVSPVSPDEFPVPPNGDDVFPGRCLPAADIPPVACQFYAVANETLDQDIFNNSQLVTFNRENHGVKNLGPLYKGYDLQALAIHPQTNRLYAVSGVQAAEQQHKGRLYMVNGDSGDLCWVGDTTFDNVSELAFSPDGSILWGWAEGQGLIQIDTATGEGQLVRSLDIPLAGFTLSRTENEVFLGVHNNELWKYNRPVEAFERLCTNLPGGIGAVEMTATAGLLLGIPDITGLGLYPFDPEPTRCELGTAIEIPLQPQQVIADVALPTAACAQ